VALALLSARAPAWLGRAPVVSVRVPAGEQVTLRLRPDHALERSCRRSVASCRAIYRRHADRAPPDSCRNQPHAWREASGSGKAGLPHHRMPIGNNGIEPGAVK
jgi:hypothetical protein